MPGEGHVIESRGTERTRIAAHGCADLAARASEFPASHLYGTRASLKVGAEKRGASFPAPFALSGDTKRGELVAGAGFEPATFWL
jgi:hypothetical protein